MSNKAVLKELKLISNRKVQNLSEVVTVNWVKLVGSLIGAAIGVGLCIYIVMKVNGV